MGIAWRCPIRAGLLEVALRRTMRGERLLRDKRSKGFDAFVRCVEVPELGVEHFPAGEPRVQCIAREQAMSLGAEHVEVSRAFDKNIDNSDTAGTYARLELGQLSVGGGAVEEHQQTDSHHRVEVLRQFVRAKIGLGSLDGQRIGRRDMSNVIDGRAAGVERYNGTAAPGGGDGQVPKATAKVENATVQVGQCRRLEWIEFKVTVADLALKLRVEELNA